MSVGYNFYFEEPNYVPVLGSAPLGGYDYSEAKTAITRDPDVELIDGGCVCESNPKHIDALKSAVGDDLISRLKGRVRGSGLSYC